MHVTLRSVDLSWHEVAYVRLGPDNCPCIIPVPVSVATAIRWLEQQDINFEVIFGVSLKVVFEREDEGVLFQLHHPEAIEP